MISQYLMCELLGSGYDWCSGSVAEVVGARNYQAPLEECQPHAHSSDSNHFEPVCMAEQVTTSLFLLVACVDELRVMALFAKSFRWEWREIWVRDSGIGLVKELSESFFFCFRWFLWPALARPRLAAGLPDPYKSNTTTSWVTCP
jgi:hypothetical protein